MMFSDAAFMKKVASTLYKTQSRSQQHIWSKAKYGIHNQNGTNGLPSHANSIVGGTIPINDMLMAWWCQYSVNHRYGIFHLAKQDPTSDTCTLVSFDTLPFKYLFGHTRFAKAFQVAVYGINQYGYFGFIDKNRDVPVTKVTLYAGATICTWV